VVISPIDDVPLSQLVCELEASGWRISYQPRDGASIAAARQAGDDFWFGFAEDGTELWKPLTAGAHALAALARLMPLSPELALVVAASPSNHQH
jgi:hypothetical protein